MSEPYWTDGQVTLHLGKSELVLPHLPADSFDSIVTDPPAGIAFMGKSWDTNLGHRDRWVDWLTEVMRAAARCLKPGGHALVWSLPRTAHWTAWAVEDAGLEIRDCVPHLFGSGFPKSLDVSKAIDKAAGAERTKVTGQRHRNVKPFSEAAGWNPNPTTGDHTYTAPATEDAARWEGWGTALKPGQEIWWLARKPLSEGSVVANVLKHGTGALNVNGCRVHAADSAGREYTGIRLRPGATVEKTGGNWHAVDGEALPWEAGRRYEGHTSDGRWPPNLVLTHSAACEQIGERVVRGDSRAGQGPGTRPGGFADIGARKGDGRPNGPLHGLQAVAVFDCAPDCPVAELDRQSGISASFGGQTSGITAFGQGSGWNKHNNRPTEISRSQDIGGASRFYPTFRYEAKAPAHERPRLPDGTVHPTVKSLALIRYFTRMVTPPGGTVLDMFAGSGTTGEACIIEGFNCVLIEKEQPSAEMIRQRLRKPIQPTMFGGGAA